MNRLASALACDVRLQVRNGFYYAAAFVALVVAAVFSRLPLGEAKWILPALLFSNLMIGTFYFVGGLVLLEKAERTLDALVVTPLRPSEYLASKTLSLTGLALVENLIIVWLAYGTDFQVLPALAGMALISILYALLGFAAVIRYDSINEYLLPSFVYTLLISLPLIDYFGFWRSWIFYLHPMQAPLILLKAAFLPVQAWEAVYGILYSALWIGLMMHWSRRAFRRFVIAREGGRR
ncbi:MAG: ABC transporter permease [Acidobacteriota bacterium]